MQGKVLIVDTIATNRIVLKVKLASAYYEVVQAGSLADAMKLAISDPPDLIISALKLPDGDAASLAAALKARPDTQDIPLLALACPPAAPDRLSALKAGVHDVLMKPVDDTLLLGTSGRALSAFLETVADVGAEYDMSLHVGKTQLLNVRSGEVISAPKGKKLSSKQSMIYLGGLLIRERIVSSASSGCIGLQDSVESMVAFECFNSSQTANLQILCGDCLDVRIEDSMAGCSGEAQARRISSEMHPHDSEDPSVVHQPSLQCISTATSRRHATHL